MSHTEEFTFGERIFGKPGDMVSINGLSGKYRILDTLYDYKKRDGCLCPNCGDVGMLWNGWYTCDGKPDCYAVAFIPTGEVFLPISKGTAS